MAVVQPEYLADLTALSCEPPFNSVTFVLNPAAYRWAKVPAWNTRLRIALNANADAVNGLVVTRGQPFNTDTLGSVDAIIHDGFIVPPQLVSIWPWTAVEPLGLFNPNVGATDRLIFSVTFEGP